MCQDRTLPLLLIFLVIVEWLAASSCAICYFKFWRKTLAAWLDQDTDDWCAWLRWEIACFLDLLMSPLSLCVAVVVLMYRTDLLQDVFGLLFLAPLACANCFWIISCTREKCSELND